VALIAVLRLAIAVLIQKKADPRARSGRLLAVTVTWGGRWVAGSAKAGNPRRPSVWMWAPWAMWASRNAATCSAVKLATTFITTYPMAPSGGRSRPPARHPARAAHRARSWRGAGALMQIPRGRVGHAQPAAEF